MWEISFTIIGNYSVYLINDIIFIEQFHLHKDPTILTEYVVVVEVVCFFSSHAFLIAASFLVSLAYWSLKLTAHCSIAGALVNVGGKSESKLWGKSQSNFAITLCRSYMVLMFFADEHARYSGWYSNIRWLKYEFAALITRIYTSEITDNKFYFLCVSIITEGSIIFLLWSNVSDFH